MNHTVASLDAAFVFAVVGAAIIFPPLGLLMGAAWLGVLVAIADHRTPPPEAKP